MVSSCLYPGQLCCHVDTHEAPLPSSHWYHFYPAATSLEANDYTPHSSTPLLNRVIQLLQLNIISEVLLSINMFISYMIDRSYMFYSPAFLSSVSF